MSTTSLRPSLAEIVEHGYRLLIAAKLRGVRAFSGDRPIPLGVWLGMHALLRRIAPYSDPLTPPQRGRPYTGAHLRTPVLRDLLRDDLLGTWALDVESIDFLWQRLMRDRPAVVVEFGAGVSSILLAIYAATRRTHDGSPALVISFEQDAREQERVEGRLRRVGLGDALHILPLTVDAAGYSSCDETELSRLLAGSRIDWALLDGPAGPDGCRIWTLPLIAAHCRPGTRWFLDDALRSSELQVLRQWQNWPGLHVAGIYPLGKGLGEGIVKDALQLAKAKRR